MGLWRVYFFVVRMFVVRTMTAILHCRTIMTIIYVCLCSKSILWLLGSKNTDINPQCHQKRTANLLGILQASHVKLPERNWNAQNWQVLIASKIFKTSFWGSHVICNYMLVGSSTTRACQPHNFKQNHMFIDSWLKTAFSSWNWNINWASFSDKILKVLPAMCLCLKTGCLPNIPQTCNEKGQGWYVNLQIWRSFFQN